MDIKNVKREDGKLSFQTAVDAASFEAAVNKAYLKAKKNIAIPGFRKGKAPRMIIEGMYGADVFYEDAVNELALDAFKAGMEEVKDRTVGDPMITNYNVADDKTLTIDFETALYPEVTLGEYKGLQAYKAPVKIMAADVNKELETIQKRNARIVAVERAAKDGDTVNIDFDGYKDGVRFDGGKAEGHDLVLGSGAFVPGFEDQIVGMKAGEEKDIDITFPENYHADLAGAAVVFKVKVNEVKESQLPALDDEFAKDVSEFDTLKEYKASIKKDLETKKKDAADSEYRNKLMAKAVENMTVTVPAAMVDERVDRVVADYTRNCTAQGFTLEQYLGMMGLDENAFRTYIRPNCENDVKVELLLEKVAEVENFTIAEEDIESEYKTAAEMYNMDVEKIKATVAAEVIADDLKMRKASELIFSTGVALDKEEESEAAAEEKPAAKKTAAKKTTKKAEATAEEKPAAKKTTKKAEASAEEKPAAKKTATKKAAAKKTEE
ncbi:MAG: trigger factor [Ruminococcaceae bacterium]|nr:trigger factor [Oscillospiraceae bacterium]